jgi:hypothetical protein
MEITEFTEKLSRWQATVKSPDDNLALPGLIEDLLSTCPKAGNGCHYWFAKAAYRLARWPFKLPAQEIHDLLEKAALANGRKPKDREIEDAIDFVLGGGSSKGPKRTTGVRRRKDKVRLKLDPQLERKARLYREKGQQELYSRSAVRKPWRLSPFEVLRHLFPVETKLATNYDVRHGNVVWLKEKAASYFERQWIVPNIPVRRSSLFSHRRKADFDSWSYQVTEFDKGSRDQQASKILWLRDRKGSPPLRLVVWSGGKSLHAWWDVDEMPNNRRERFLNVALSIGADPAHKTINQLARMPNAIRPEKQKRQSVIYLYG